MAADGTSGEVEDGAVFVDRDGRQVLVRIAALSEIIALRHSELRPGLPEEAAQFDGDLEPTTRHFGAFFPHNATGELTISDAAPDATTVACASFMAGERTYQLRGMATRAGLVGRGLGGALLRHAIAELVRREGARRFWCNARVAAVQFYLRMGWQITSDVFDVPTVGPHRVMQYDHSPASSIQP